MIKELTTKTALIRKVIRVCDICKDEKEVRFVDILKCRTNQGSDIDYCLPCSRMKKASGKDNPMHSQQAKDNIRKTRLGRSKTYKDGDLGRQVTHRVSKQGYIIKQRDGIRIPEHRTILQESLGRKLSPEEIIHHINGDKKDNSLSNMFLTTKKGHAQLHAQLEQVALDLVRRGAIIFDKIDQKYLLHPSVSLSFLDISLGFESVAIKQNKSICKSRLDVEIKSEIIRGVVRPIPLIASNMSTVVNSDFCNSLYKLGALGVMHRAGEDGFLCKEVKKIASECEWVAASIGVGASQYYLATSLIGAGANIIVIDVAHGFSSEVIELAQKLKKQYHHVKIVVGNTTNVKLLEETYEFVDAIKIGIAQGFACETKNTAGCT